MPVKWSVTLTDCFGPENWLPFRMKGHVLHSARSWCASNSKVSYVFVFVFVVVEVRSSSA